VVTIACSQLEKLKAAILNIKQKRDKDANSYQKKEQGQVKDPQEVFRHTQQHLNDCIRHHQQILEYDKLNYFASNLNSWEIFCYFQFTDVGFDTC
jgi:hypothetical protein